MPHESNWELILHWILIPWVIQVGTIYNFLHEGNYFKIAIQIYSKELKRYPEKHLLLTCLQQHYSRQLKMEVVHMLICGWVAKHTCGWVMYVEMQDRAGVASGTTKNMTHSWVTWAGRSCRHSKRNTSPQKPQCELLLFSSTISSSRKWSLNSCKRGLEMYVC
jgi:hypothetical protein